MSATIYPPPVEGFARRRRWPQFPEDVRRRVREVRGHPTLHAAFQLLEDHCCVDQGSRCRQGGGLEVDLAAVGHCLAPPSAKLGVGQARGHVLGAEHGGRRGLLLQQQHAQLPEVELQQLVGPPLVGPHERRRGRQRGTPAVGAVQFGAEPGQLAAQLPASCRWAAGIGTRGSPSACCGSVTP